MSIETEDDLWGLRKIGQIVALTLQTMRKQVRPNMTTRQLDTIGWNVLKRHNARPAPFITYNFPGVACISINDEAAHGIPRQRRIRPGDVVKIDVSAELDGYFADAAITVLVPPVSPIHQQLCDCAQAALAAALATARANMPINQIGLATEQAVRQWGFRVIRDLPGHGVGRALHEEPSVPFVYSRQLHTRLTDGLVITIEPHIAVGSDQIVADADGWTLRTQDGSFAAAYEHTVIITRARPILVTAW